MFDAHVDGEQRLRGVAFQRGYIAALTDALHDARALVTSGELAAQYPGIAPSDWLLAVVAVTRRLGARALLCRYCEVPLTGAERRASAREGADYCADCAKRGEDAR